MANSSGRIAGLKATVAVGSRVGAEQSWADRGFEENRCDRVADLWTKGAVGPRQTEKKRRFMAAENDNRKDKTKNKTKIKTAESPKLLLGFSP